ncbi:hypothetical protein RhiirA5_430362 [Rhizophagus irregularis]|uniref:Uncharacterized protein n=1 Tax=Rhizophagus irregularis TaxID=588596 RepID=A0A2N0NWV0_9GLOM|nr:hypothetical protein RhiirA5_430362 [Rhizophagus irregularis]
MSDTRLLTFGNSSVRYDQLFEQVNCHDSVMYKNDIMLKLKDKGFFVYLFIMGEIVDSYLNRNLAPLERIRILMTGFFILRLWRFHIKHLAKKYSDFIFIRNNFLADQTFTILNSLCKSMLHGSEPVEYLFGIARQINSDFDFAELIQMVPKISQHTKALRNEKLNFNKEKSVREGYQFECNSNSIDDNPLEMLRP